MLTPSRPANAPSWFAKFVRQLLVGPQDAWRPNQTFHLLQFWPRRNEACCYWPLVSSGKLMPFLLCCIQRSKLVPTFRLSKHLVRSWQVAKWATGGHLRDLIYCTCLHPDSAKPGSPRSPARECVCLCEPCLRQRELLTWELSTFVLSLLLRCCSVELVFVALSNPFCWRRSWLNLIAGSKNDFLFTPRLLQLLRINLCRSGDVDWKNPSCLRLCSLNRVQCPHLFWRMVVTMMTRCASASGPFNHY